MNSETEQAEATQTEQAKATQKQVEDLNTASPSSLPSQSLSPSHLASSKAPLTSLFKTALWLIVFIYLTPLLLTVLAGFFGGLVLGATQGADANTDSLVQTLFGIPAMLIFSLITAGINIPLINKATPASHWQERFEFWAIKETTTALWLKWMGISLVFWFGSTLLSIELAIPEEQFMLDLKAASEGVPMLLLIVVTVCLVVPVMEELIFRGWLFSKIKQTLLGNIGALIITATIFTLIHTQYEQPFTLMMIFTLGLLFGFIRYKTNNIMYSISAHILFNILAMISLWLM